MNDSEQKSQIDADRLKRAIDWVLSNDDDDAMAYYEQPIADPYPTSVFVEVVSRKGMLNTTVRRFGGATNQELTQEASLITTEHLGERVA